MARSYPCNGSEIEEGLTFYLAASSSVEAGVLNPASPVCTFEPVLDLQYSPRRLTAGHVAAPLSSRQHAVRRKLFNTYDCIWVVILTVGAFAVGCAFASFPCGPAWGLCFAVSA